MKQNNIPTPIKTILIGDENIGYVLSLYDSNDNNFANMKLFGTNEECEALSKNIFRIINSHEALVEVLKELKGALLILKAPKESLLKAENALKLAEGE